MKSGAVCRRRNQAPNLAGAIMPRRPRIEISGPTPLPHPRISNSEPRLLETQLSHRKQSTEPRPNRELSTISKSGSNRITLEIIQTGEFFSG